MQPGFNPSGVALVFLPSPLQTLWKHPEHFRARPRTCGAPGSPEKPAVSRGGHEHGGASDLELEPPTPSSPVAALTLQKLFLCQLHSVIFYLKIYIYIPNFNFGDQQLISFCFHLTLLLIGTYKFFKNSAPICLIDEWFI